MVTIVAPSNRLVRYCVIIANGKFETYFNVLLIVGTG